MPLGARILPVLLAIAGAAAAVAAAAALPFPTAGQTRAEFEAVCERLRVDNLYFGSAVVGRLEAELARPLAPAQRILRLGQLGFELVRLDRLDEAMARFDEALALADAEGLPPAHDLRGRLEMTRAVAHLIAGEDANCVERHTPRSCILPIAEEAVHRLPERARRAGDLFLGRLGADPDDLQARWLLNVARRITGDYPEGVPERWRAPALPTAPGFPEWSNVAHELGVAAVDLAGGAVMDDFDGDGLLDLVSSSSDPCEPMKAYRNDGRGGFEEATAAWGLDGQLGGLNLAPADFDGDGALDLLVLRGAWLGTDGRIRNSLLRNDLGREAGVFVDVTAGAGLAHPAYPTQTAAWADYDLDGDLDLYVGNEATEGTTDPLTIFGRTGQAYPSQLFRNDGDGTFTDVARTAGVANRRFTKGVAWGDYDDDGDPDLYVSTFGDNRLYRNGGDGTFVDVAPELGVVEPSRNSFPTWFFDVDNDGDLDLFAADYKTPVAEVSGTYLGMPQNDGQPKLYLNDGGRFTEASRAWGLDRPLLPMGANYGDIDNDGFPDVYLGTGVPDFEALMPNAMYRNTGSGFEEVTFSGGFGHLQKGHGVAFGDLDNDGDQDLFEQMGGAFPFDAYANALYENPGGPHRWIVLRLEGLGPGRGANRFGVGARLEVRVRAGDARRSVHALAGTGGSFGASSHQQEIGLGAAEAIESVTVRWPGGRTQTYPGVPLDGFYRALEGAAELVPVEVPRLRLGGGSPAHPRD